MRTRKACVALSACLAWACGGGRGIEGDATGDTLHPDTHVDLPEDPPADDVSVPDAECDTEVYWTRAPRMIDTVELVDGMARAGVTERYVVAVVLQSGCELLAGIDLRLEPGDATDFVGLAASAWMPVGLDCPPVAPVVERVVAIPGRLHGNLRVVVIDDNAPGGGLRLTYDRDPCSGVPECMCGPDTPPGSGAEWSDCRTDCSCADGLSCIGYFGIGGPMWSCARICSDFRDCETRETCLPAILDGAPHVCSWDGDLCDGDEDCPPGFTCTFTDLASFCSDSREGPTGRECECDSDCPEGHLCIDAGAGAACEIPCLTTAWCPETPIEGPICTNQYVCSWPD